MNDAVQPASGDAVSRKSITDMLKRELGYCSKEKFESNHRFYLGRETALTDMIRKIESIPSIPSPAEGRYREALEEALLCWAGRGRHESASDVLKEMLVIIRQALSPSGEQISLRSEVQWFAEQMEKVLRANDHKGGWERCDYNYLLGRMQQEKNEIHDALIFNHPFEQIVSECADVANFAMMIADIARRSSSSPSGEQKMSDHRKKLLERAAQFQFVPGHGIDLSAKTDEYLEKYVRLMENSFDAAFKEEDGE